MSFDASLAETLRTLQALTTLRTEIDRAGDMILATLRRGGKLLIAGNGGSAAEAAHFATELVGRYAKNRRSLPAVALSSDGSLLSCIGNDFGYERVFSGQKQSAPRPWLIPALTVASLASMLVILSYFFTSMNYVEDFTPSMYALAVVFLGQGYDRLMDNPRARRLYLAVAILLIVITIVSGILLALPAKR